MPSNVHVMVDYNQALSLDEAMRRGRALDGEGVYWIEEPIRHDDYRGCARIAAARGIEMSSHLFPEVSAHLLAVTPTAHWLEYVDWAAPVLAEPMKVIDGFAHIPDRPGNGLAWNPDAVERFRMKA